MTRHTWVLLHRYAGLGMTVFLIVVGLTGSLLAFNSELERVFAPGLFATPRPGVAPLDLAALAERAETLVPHAHLGGVAFTEADQVRAGFVADKDPATGQPYPLGFNQYFIDPWTGAELGRRTRGDLAEGVVNVMPFIYDLHWRLALGGFGQWTLGIVALIWTLDCFGGAYLTLPRTGAGFWRRWKLAWSIRRGASPYRLNFDVHRAGGLWLWAALFIFAWSSVMMNIRIPVYDWVTRTLFDYRSPIDEFRALPKRDRATPALGWRAALATGERLMAEQASRHNFTTGQALGLMYMPGPGAYVYEVRGSRDLFERAPKGGSTSLMFDGNTGALLRLSLPTGEHAGNTVESWLYALHMARVFGRPYQVFVCALGFLVALLSITGVYIWWQKRRARTKQAVRRAVSPR
jgi:uncharacterized iron-regulated membrane protein